MFYRSRKNLWLALYGALVLTIVPSYFTAYPLPEFLAKVKSCGGALLLCLFCFSLGTLVLDLIQIDRPTGKSFIRIWVAPLWMGSGILGFLVFVLGWALPGKISLKLTGLFIFLLLIFLHQLINKRLPFPIFSRTNFSLTESLFLMMGTLGALVSFVSSFSPITYYDSLVYHLALPNQYLQMGRIAALPSNLYSYFPANIEMVFLFILSQFPEPEYVINLWGWTLSLNLSLGLSAWAYDWGGKRPAIFAFFLWWTMPAILLLSVGAYVDLPLAGFTFLAFWMFCQAASKNWSTNIIFYSGFFGGLALATKYTGGLTPLLLSTALVYSNMKRGKNPAVPIFIFWAGVMIPSCGWFIKNYLSIGNPIFPFAYSWWGGGEGWSHETAQGYFNQLTEYGTTSHLLLEIFRAPWNLSVHALKYGGGFDVLGDFGWPLLIFLAPLVFIFSWRKPIMKGMICFVGASFIFWLASKPVFRFLIPILPFFILLSSEALTGLLNLKIPGKIISLLIAIPFLFSNFFLFFLISNTLQTFRVPLGLESRNDFLHRVFPFYSVYNYANLTLQANDKLILLGEQRTYHLKVPFISSNLFSLSSITKVCNDSISSNEMQRFLQKNGITHLLINEPEIERLGGLSKFGFNENGRAILRSFITQNTQTLFENHRVKLAQIKQ
ncbi:MAG: hypothetical protein KCHDKBKB_00578 [Elusimicrobia bacterium]|nr:hypothetical protein [Elusimicrobiota bacterium]